MTSSSGGDNSQSLARARMEPPPAGYSQKDNSGSGGEPSVEAVTWTYEISKAVINVQVHVHLVNNESLHFHHQNYQNQIFRASNHASTLTRKVSNENTSLGIPLSTTAASGNQYHQHQQASQNRNLEPCSTATYNIKIHRRNAPFNVDIKNLKGFDKTGRICIWPSEQILCYWVLKNMARFEGKRVIEIGGGFHCLAGLAVAKYAKAQHVILTDGDEVNVEEVSYSIQRNNLVADSCHATTLRWDDCKTKPEFEAKFDFVIAADVIYENSVFGSLLETISFVLKPEGQFILFNPTRDGMLQEFVRLAKSMNAFSDVKFIETYDTSVSEITWDLIQNNPSYNREWHYPNQVAFQKVASVCSQHQHLPSSHHPIVLPMSN
ncbi:Calmodulin-lysine N-methyltransferase [Orchesella cincta]|uniref:Calmodulin-lysine N-methyltransferase n=1 Tax=Orchesella cincta TaxID=48709 RepID=A0A1D2MXC0_ORCCI|nr:Calmodulin-lysine N-methyltransferase [Orchesella cincta]